MNVSFWGSGVATKYVPARKIDAFIQLFVSDPKMDDSRTGDRWRQDAVLLFVTFSYNVGPVRELVVIVSEANWTFPGFFLSFRVYGNSQHPCVPR